MDEYLKKVRKLISEQTGMELDEINEDSYFEDDLNMGQMELVELLTELEEIYQVEGLLEEKENLETVQDIIDILVEKVD
jgi:acyl carrier protein